MSVQSSAPPRAGMVYTLLIVLGVLAAALGASVMGWIVYAYVTDEELRNPPQAEAGAVVQAELPEWLVRV